MPLDQPEILAVTAGEHSVRLDLRLPHELSWFEGHFSDCPLLPGVIQVTWAVEFGRRHLPVPSGFQSLSAVKFMRFILPGAEVALQLEFDAARRKLAFEYRERGAVCSGGTIGFGAAAR